VTSLEWVTIIVAAGILLVWITRCWTIYSPRARGPVLSHDTIPDVPPSGLVSIIVPCKDEESNIAAALETLLAQDYPQIEIIVVDDRSRDRTAEIVREVAARDPRVRLVQVKELPPGWFGKPHAMHVGAHEARGEWLLFVDADCRQVPHSVRAGVNFLASRGGEMLSLWPVLEMRGFWENVLQPVAGSVLVAWFRPGWVNNPKMRTAFANGQYVLMRKATYEAVGGYEAVRSEIVEDIALARHVKGLGHALWNATGADLFTTRMYDTLAGMYKGWSRIYYGAFKSAWRLLVVIALTIVFTLAPFVALAVSAVALAADACTPMMMGLFCLELATVLVLLITMRRYFIAGRANPWYLLFYPLGVSLALVLQLGALLHALGLRGVTWRGTTYKGGKVVAGGK